jgi:hypothetical protein
MHKAAAAYIARYFPAAIRRRRYARMILAAVMARAASHY